MAGYTIPDGRDELIRALVRELEALRGAMSQRLTFSGATDQERAQYFRTTDEALARARQHLEATP
jgi:hypothetical protein